MMMSFDLCGEDLCERSVPGFDDVRKFQFYCPISSIPEALTFWLGVNPRLAQRTPIHTGIHNTLIHNPRMMVIKNAGLILSGASAAVNKGNVEVTLSTKKLHGLIDGNNTRAAIARFCEQIADDGRSVVEAIAEAFIEVSIYTGLQRDEVVEVASGQNIRKPVQKHSLLNMTGYFDEIRSGLLDGNRSDEISYFEGDPGTIDIKFLLQLLMSLNTIRFQGDASPMLYAHVGKCINMWEDDYKVESQDQHCPSQILALNSSTILDTYDVVLEKIPSLWNNGGKWGSVEHKATQAIALVVMQALRPVVDMDLANGSFSMLATPEDVLGGCGMDIIDHIRVEYNKTIKRRADNVGKTTSLYKLTYGTVHAWAKAAGII